MHEVRIPKLGLDTIECGISAWLVKVGDRLERGTPLLEVESEKAVMVIEAEVSGVLRDVRAQAGETVAVGALVGLIDDDGKLE